MMKIRKLHNYILSRYIVIAIIPLCLIAAAVILILQKNIRNSFQQKNTVIVQSVASRVDQFLIEPLKAMKLLTLLIENDRKIDFAKVPFYFDSFRASYPYFNQILIVNKNKRIECMSPMDEDVLHNDVSNESYALDVGENTYHWSNVFSSFDNGLPLIALSAGLNDYIVVGIIDISRIQTIIKDVKVEKPQSYLAILNENGTFIAHSNSELVNQRESEVYFRKIFVSPDSLTNTIINIEGKDKLVSISRLATNNWHVVIYNDMDEVLMSIRNLNKLFIPGISLSLIGVVILAFFSTKKIKNPLYGMIKRTEMISRGDYRIRFNPMEFVEFEDLAAHFSNMADSIQRRENDLQEKESKLLKSNRLYNVLSRVNSTITKSIDPDTLFAEICRITVETGKVKGACIGLLNNGQITFSAYYGVIFAQNNSISLDEANICPAVHAALSNHVKHCSTSCSDGCILNLFGKADREAIKSSVVYPLFLDGKIMGIYCVFSRYANYFDDAESSLFTEIANDISFAIGNIKHESERVKYEHDLIISNKKYRVLFDAFPLGIIVLDQHGIMKEINKMAESLFRFNSSEYLGKPYNSLGFSFIDSNYNTIPENKLPSYISRTRKLLAINTELGVIGYDGILKWFSVTAAPIPLDDYSTAVTFNDVSKKVEAQKQLIIEKEKAEESSRLKSSLLANLNHEFRTPLTGILGMADELNEELTDTEQKKMAGNILRSARRLQNTLTSILYLSEIESGRIDEMFDEVSLSWVIRKILSRYISAAQEKNLEIQTCIDEDIVVYSDSKLIELILLNVIDNAVKYTSKGYIRIELSPDIDSACIRVKDTGIGIDKENAKLVFQPFRQVSEGFGRSFEGTGLGLTLAKKMIELMNGSISFESQVGEGSEFIICIPLNKHLSVNKYQKDKKHSFPNPAEGIHNTTGREILVVEDNAINALVTKLSLKNHYTLEHAKNAVQALEMINNAKYSAILMDINLGAGMNGIDLLGKIREHESYKNVPVIAITGYSTAAEIEALQKAGFTDYLSKPFEKHEILQVLQKCFAYQ